MSEGKVNLNPQKPKKAIFKTIAGLLLLASYSTSGYSVSYDGEGHYSLLAQTRTNPAFSRDRGLHEAIIQNFRLLGEIRSSDTTSFFMEFSLFDNPRTSYLGDSAKPKDCSTQETSFYKSEPCQDKTQNTGEPRYSSLYPQVRKAYAQFAFDKCLLQAGRRGRSWGVGIFLDDGDGPFDQDASVYDGVSCHINIQKSQTMSMMFGFDKISETGSAETASDTKSYGSTARSDDINQYFFSLEYDDRNVNSGSGLTQKVGIYFANVTQGAEGEDGSDIKFADLYTSFYLPSLIFKNELLFRLGKSSDPSWARLGGAYPIPSTDGTSKKSVSNDLNAIAFAGNLEYILSRSGSIIGPEEYFKGSAESHSLFLDYAYAPGDEHGYMVGSKSGLQHRKNTKATAVAFHRNYKPALVLFNDLPQNDDMRVDGIYDPGRVMNATVFGLGYQYRSLESGNFQIKVVGANLIETIDNVTKQEILDDEADRTASGQALKDRPVGFGGKALGYELDLKYDLRIGKSIELGAAGGLAFPGEAFRIQKDKTQTTSILVQSHISFFF